MRGVGGVTAAGKAVEPDIPTQFGLQPPLEARPQGLHRDTLALNSFAYALMAFLTCENA
jgi:hypothetical protein